MLAQQEEMVSFVAGVSNKRFLYTGSEFPRDSPSPTFPRSICLKMPQTAINKIK
jgi:hypothetical protein